MGVRAGGLLGRMRGVLSRGVAVLPLAAAGSGHAFAQSLEAAGTVIIPDGRTATSLTVDGTTTDVTTGTMAGGNAYNSFSRFEVGGSSTVNLHVPVDAGHLINIVRDAPVLVDGTLNAMRDGRIGGNVVFADPYGFIVNKNGVVNAGSLTVVTPTRDFLEHTIDGAGRIDTALGARIIDGDVPISPDGSIVIRGKVNTDNGVILKGNTVTVDGPARHQAQFEATVNTKGRRSGGQIVVQNGKLRIVAAGAARIGGKLKAGGRTSGGVIEIGAAEITVLPTARIEALRANDADALVAASEAVRRASAGKVSITAAGNLSVAGSIRAEGSSHAGGAIALAGGGVDIAARADIAATIAPIPTSREAALAGPSVAIRSTGDLSVAGKVSADGADGRSGGNIDVLAVRDIALAATAELSANGAGDDADGGRIIVFADRNLAVADGFTVKAAAGTTGDGGFVELSAKKVVELATMNLDLGATGGRAGTLLIDPEDVVIGSGSVSGTTYMTSRITNGAAFVIEASNSITIKSNYTIDTRMHSSGVSTGDSGNVRLTSGTITIENGGSINTSVSGASTYAAGNVTLEAQTINIANGAMINAGGGTAPTRAGDVTLTAKKESTGDHWGEDGKTDKFATSITVNGTVTGKTVTLESYARYEVGSLHAGTSSTVSINGTITGTAINVLSKSESRSNYNDSGIEFGILEGVISALNPLGLDAAWISSSAKAHLNIGGNANITGGTVKLESLAIGESVDQAVGLNPSGSAHLSIGVIVGMVDTDARTNVAQGARITTTESLGVSAVTDTRLNVLSSVISGVPFVGGMLGGAPVVGAVAYGSADVDAYATIQANATIGGTGSVTVLARSDNMFSVNAKVYGAGNAKAGGALAISEVNSSTIARLGSSVDNTAAATPRDVMVQAISNVKTHDTSASTTVGDGVVGTILAGLSATGNLIGGATPNIEGVSTLIFDKFIRSPAGGASNTPAVKGAASLSLATGSITADASIARDPTGGLVPVIRTNGNISVVSDVASKKIVSTSSAGVNPGGVQPTQAGMAVGVAVFEVGHYSRAYLGAGAQAHGRNVGINAFTNIPVGIFLQNWDNALQVIGDAFFAILANPGLITSGAKATTESSGAALAGSYNHFKLGVDTVAWLAQGAQITSTGNGERWQIEKLDAIGKPETDGAPRYDDDDNLTNRVLYSFDAAVDIAASTAVESLNVAGNWGLGAGNAGGNAVGGSVGNVFFDIATVAGVADSASVTAAADVDVDSTSKNFTLVISPSNGSGSSIAGSGLVGYSRFDGRTHATISNAADVTANTVNVRAEDKQNIYAGAGQVQRGGGSSIGLSIAIVDANTDTAAYVGNNVGAGGSAVDAQTAATSRQGRITVDDMTVRAWTRGEVVVASVAAVSSDPAPKTPPPGTPSKAMEMLMGSQTSVAPSFSLTISGSSSVLINDLDTRAYLDRADVRRRNGTATTSVSVEAVNTVNSYSISGSGAVAVGGPSSVGSAGVAGALALGGSDNSTVAYIANSNLDDITNVAVQALAGGGYTVAAVGLSLSADSNSLLSIAGSVSIALIEDSVRASIDNSTVDGTSGGSVDVTAYRKTEISIGGGSMGVGGKVGAGMALTYTKIRDGEDGPAALARISGSTIGQYLDLSAIAAAPSRIYSGAAATAFGANTNSLAGAIISNDIGGSIIASIEGDSDDEIDVSRHVNVKSGTADADSLNAKLAAATDRTNRAANNYSAVTYENAENGAVTEIAAGAAIVSMAGSVAAGQNSIGATIINNDVHQSHVARIVGATVGAGENVTVAATDTTSILGIGIGLGVATGAFAGQAGVVTNRVNSSIAAEIGTGAEVAAGNIAVTAQDAVVVRGSVVSAAISSGIGGSAAVAVNQIAMDVSSTVTGATIATTGSIDVTARSTADILTVAAGISLGSSGGLAGSAATSKIATNVRALVLSGSDIDAGNNVVVDARNSGRISVVAGSVGVGAAGAGIGLSVTVNEIGGDTEARIADSEVDANGSGADKQVQAGALVTALSPGTAARATPDSGVGFATPDFTQQTRSVSGVAVLANSTQTVSGVAVTVGLAGAGPAAAIMPVITVAGGRTVAAIDRSTVGTELDTSSDVLVSASSHSFSGNFGIGGAASASATAGAAVSITTTMKRSTEARILDSTVGETGALTVRPAKVTVEAVASQSASDIAVGVAAGLMAGAGGSAIVTVFNADTEAFIEGGQLRAGSAKVSADSTNGYFAAAGAAAVGLFGGKSGAAVVGVSKNTTVARIGRTGKTTGLSFNGDLEVLANSRNVFTSHAYGFAGGVIGAPIAGQALVTVVANDTQAILRDATITIANEATVPTGASTTRPAGINLAAFESVETRVATGGGALTLFGVGTGAAANVVVLTSKVQADSSGGSISLPGIFDIAATTDKVIDAKTITAGGGLAGGIGAAVGVIIAGGATAGDAMAELNKDGEGTLASLNRVSAAGEDFVLAQAEIAGWRSRADAEIDGSGTPTDAQVQAWARARYVELLGAGSFANDGSYQPDPELEGAELQQAIDDWAALTADRAGYVLADDKLADYAGKALSATELEAFEDLLGANNSSGINFVLKARTDLDAYAAQAQAALGLDERPTDAQIETYIEERFEEYATRMRSELGLSSDPTDAEIATYFEERYAGFVAAIRVKADVDYRALVAAGTIEGGRLVLATSNVSALAASTLTTSESALFGTLHAARAAGDDFSLANVDAIYANGKSFRQVAAEALDQDLSGAGNDASVQAYWTAQYKGLANAISNGADAQYRDFNSNRLTARENFSVTNAASNANEGVYAGISSGSVTAGGIAVDAISAVSAKNFASGVGGGVFGVGLGAALAYTESNATVSAYVKGNVTAGAIVANALARDGSGGSAADSRAAAGAGGLKAAIGAAVAVATSANTVTATLGGTVTGTGGSSAAFANAMDTTSLWTEAVGATEGGGAAVGASIATSLKSSTVEANIVAASNVGGWGNVMVNAGTAGGLSSKAIAGAGGLGAALSGAVAESRSNEIVNASIGNGATVSAGLVDVVATAIPRLSAESLGISIAGGLAAGASVAESISEAKVKAFTGENVRVIGGGLNIEASALLPRIGTNAEGQPIYGDTAWSKAVAGSGGILVGVNATIAHSISRSEVEAYAGKGLKLPNGTVSILAVNDSRQKSDSTGIAVGFLGVGVTEAISSSAGWSKAWLDEDAETQQTRTGGLVVSASGINENLADSTAGAGGVVAGSASLAKTEDKTSTLAELRSGGSNYTIYTTGLSVDARHDTIFKSYADSFQASAIGAAGAEAKNLIDSDVTAQIGEGMIVHSLDSVFIGATTTTTQKGGGARAGSGGVIAGAGAVSETKVYNDTVVTIGEDTVISLNGDPTTADVRMGIEAFNRLTTGDTVTVDSGGYYAGGGGKSELIATISNTVNIADNVHLFSVGNLQVGTASVNMANNAANASLYGVVTGAGATTNAVITATQNITLGDDVTLEAIGSINLTAGRSASGSTASLVSANATTEVYNYALIPITAAFDGRARAYNTSTLTMGDRNEVLAGRDITIGAYKGVINANGRGTNHNPYLTLFNSTEKRSDGEGTGHANAVLKGTISAGMNNSFAVTVEADGDVVSTLPSAWQFTRVNTIAETGTNFVSYNDRKLRYAVTGSFNPYADIVTRISTLLNLGEEHVRWRLETRNDIFYGLAPTDEVRRQVETFVNQVYTAGAVPNRMVNSVAIGSMMASAGNVTINANNLTGSSATVTARGAPGIDILNQTQGFLILNKLLLTTNEGGNVEFTGDDRSEAGINVVEVSSRVTPEIRVRSTWEDPLGSPAYTPDIYFLGSVSALDGNLTVRNESGNVTVLSPNFEAAAINMVVPRGNLTANMGPDSFWEPGGSPISAWRNGQYRPSTAAQAVMAVATYLNPQANFKYDGVTRHDSDPIFSARILVKQYQGKVNDGPSFNGLLSDVWFKVYPDNIGDQASQTNWESEFRGGWYRWDAWNGEGDNSGPFAWMVFDVITRQPLLQERGAADPNRQTPSTQIIGGSILITAETININGTIQSGYSNSWSVDIGSAAENMIAWYKNDAGLRAANAGRMIELPVNALSGAHSKVRAFYDVSNDRIELQHVTKGSGGRVYLNGGIISTSTTGTKQGLIRVNGGYVTADIRNHTNTALVVNTINTGEASAISTVEIVDHYKGNHLGPLRSWYVYDVSNPNAPVSLYQQYGNNTDYRNAQLQWQSASLSGHSYNPAANLVYQWVETAHMTRDANIHGMTQLGEWTFVSNQADPYTIARSVETRTQSTNFRQTVTGSGSFYSVSASMSRNNGTDFHGTWQQNVYDRATLVLTNSVWASFPIDIQFLGGANAQVTINSNATVVLNAAITNVNGSTSITANGANSAIISGADGSVTGKSVTLHGQGGIGTADRAVTVQTYGGTLTASSTDRDINISHRGDVNVASIRVNGAGGQDPRGNVKLSATGDIYSSAAYNVANPIIVGKSIELNSIGGAIGARTGVLGGQQVLTNINPIVLQASGVRLANGSIDGGVIDSTSSTGTYLVQSRSDMRVGRVTSNGAVFLAAAGSDGQTANILAGASRTGPTIEETERLRQIWDSLDLMREAQQDGTVGADGELNTNVYAGSAAVHGYQAMINRAYEDYWLLRAMAFDNEGNYAINSAGKAAMQAQMAEQLEDVEPEDVNAAIEAEVRRRYGAARYVLGLSTDEDDETAFKNQLHAGQRDGFVALQAGVLLGGLDEYWTEPVVEPGEPAPPPVLRFGYDDDFSYELDENSTLFANLTSGSRWTIEQLTYTIDAAAAADVPQQSLAERRQNVSASEVMLYAPRGSIGSLADPRTIVFYSNNPGALSEADRVAISNAGPGEMRLVAEDVGNGISRYTVTLAQQNLLVASATGNTTVEALSDIYLGSHLNLKLGGISNGLYPGGSLAAAQANGAQTGTGSVRLEAIGNIVGATAGQAAITGNIDRLTLISEQGSIGQAGAAGADPATNANALLLALTGANTGSLNLAQAMQGIYLRQTTGDLIVGNITGGAAVQLAAAGSIYALPEFTDRRVRHIVGGSLDLRAGGSIGHKGTSYQPLQVAITGAVTGHSTGNLSILSPTAAMTIGRAGAYGTLTAGGSLLLDAQGGALTLNRTVSAGGNISLFASGQLGFAAQGDETVEATTSGNVVVAAGSLLMGAGSRIAAGGLIDIVTAGSATIGQIASTLASASNATVPLIEIVAGSAGSIRGNGDAVTNLVASATGGMVLSAGAAIDLAVSAAWLDAETGTGDLAIRATREMRSTALRSTGGAVNVTGAGALMLGSVSSGAATSLTASGGSIAFATLTAGTSATLDAEGDLTGTSLTTGGAATLDASRKIDIAALDIGTVLTSTAGTTTEFALAEAGTSMGVTSGGLIDIVAASAGTGNASLTSTGSSVRLGALSAGGSVVLDAEDDIEADEVTAAALDATAGGGIEIAEIETTGLAELDAAEAITGTSLSAGSAKLKAGTIVDIVTIATVGSTEIEAGDDILATMLTTGGAATLDAGRKIDTATLDIGAALTSTAATTTKFNLVEAGTSMDVTSGGLIDIAAASTGTGSASLTSSNGSILLGTLTTGGSANLDADEDITGSSLTTGGAATLDAGREIDIATLDIGAALTSTAATTTKFNLVEAVTSISVSSGDGVDIATATTGSGDALLTSAGGSILLGALTAGGAALLDAAQDVTGTSVTTGGAATLDAGRKIDIATLDIGSVLTSTAVTTTKFNLAEAGTSMSVTSGGLIDVATAATGSGNASLTSTGGSILFGALTAGGAALLDAAEDVTGTSVTTGGAATLDAGRKIDIATLDIGSILTSTAVTTTKFNLAEAGTSMSVISGGLIDIATATTGSGNASLTSTGGSIRLGALMAGGSANLDADDDVDADEVTAGAAITVGAGGGIDIAELDAGTSAALVAGQQIAATTARSGSSTSLTAGNSIDVSTLNVGTAFDSSSGTTTRFTSLTAGESMAVTSGGRLDIAAASAGANASFTSTGSSIALVTVAAGGDVDVHAAADAGIDGATVDGAFNATAGAALDIRRVDAGASIQLAAGSSLTATSIRAGTSASLNAGASIDTDTLSAGSTLAMNAGGGIDARDVHAGTALNASAGLGAAFASLAVGTDLGIVANGAISIGNATTGGAATLRSTSADVVVTGLASGTDAHVEAAGAVNAASLRAGNTATVRAGGAIAVDALAAGVDAILGASGTATAADVAAGRHLTVTAGLGANLTTAAAGGDFSATAGGDLRIATAAAGGRASASSTAGSLEIGSLFGETVTLAAATQVSADSLQSGGAMKVQAPVVRIGAARSGTGLAVDATSLIDANSLGAHTIDLTTGSAGSVRLGRAEAVRLAIVSGTKIDAAELALRDSAVLAADEIVLPSVMHTGAGAPLALDVTGRDGTEARRFETFLSTPFGVAFGDYRVADANIGTSGTLVTIARGFASGTLTLRTALRSIFMNNRAATPVPGFDVQLFQPKYAFKLVQDGMTTTTDAFIVNFGEGSEVFFEMNGMVFAGMSMVREFEKALQGASGGDAGGTSPFGSDGMARPSATFLASFLAAQTRDGLLVNGGDGDSPAVNLDTTVTNPLQQ